MEFQFKVQQYQTDAVQAVVKVFAGQKYQDRTKYVRDLGKEAIKPVGAQIDLNGFVEQDNEEIATGFRNETIGQTDDQILNNIHQVQTLNNIKLIESLDKTHGRCSLDIEMETGTGKTYVYIKTMFELNKMYGWSKFIVVVPSIAIREGVKSSFELTQEHFMEHYGKKARFFVYDSSNLTEIDRFSSSSGINVMIINTQAFNTSLKEEGKSKDSRIIYSERDEFASRRPIDVIKANNPILILDEPQKMGGDATQKAIRNFNPLFTINYSATHAKKHNLIYVLDALDAYNKKLVKKIEVKGFQVKNFRGSDGYMYLEKIIISPTKPPIARLEIEIAYNKSINREFRLLNEGDSLYAASGEMEQYKGFTITSGGIDPITGTVTFTNGEEIRTGEVVGDVSEKDMRRIQIRETILSHFQKEEQLFNKGIKTLSLFFIDEVKKYRDYTIEDTKGDYARVFEQEYRLIVEEKRTLFPSDYVNYLEQWNIEQIHKGYFSIDKKSGRSVDSDIKRGEDSSDDVSAYDLIMKDKKRLLSFEEPTRFIFSHSALREGWDNPNIFQICTLKHSDSTTMKRQEVGRGLRLCVNREGTRMDLEVCGEQIHKLNKLTVIASESYTTFVDDLQKQIKQVLYDRPLKATTEYFTGKTVLVDGKSHIVDAIQARQIYKYLLKNDYIDDADKVTDAFRNAVEDATLAPLPDELKSIAEGVVTLVQSIFDESVFKKMIEDGNATTVDANALNDRFYRKEFQELWNEINHKYAYTVRFESAELIEKSVQHINEKLFVSALQYTVTRGEQKINMDENELARSDSFKIASTHTQELKTASRSQVPYDLIGKIASGAIITRRSAAEILKQLPWEKRVMFAHNPEEFISKVVRLIKEQKAAMVVDHISYNRIDGSFDSTIFTAQQHSQPIDKAFAAKKAVQDYIFTDGSAEESVERRFARELDNADEVCVYAKLPREFKIPTPVGNYSPDWAIAFNKETVKHIFFVAETKGTLESLELRGVEAAKIKCAKRLFNTLSTSKVKYHDVTCYQDLLDKMRSL
jgi:type III restriction enzyme